MKTSRLIFVLFILLLPGMLMAEVTVVAPQVSSITLPGGIIVTDENVINNINTSMTNAGKSMFTEISTAVAKFEDQPDLAKGFANAAGASAHVGTQRSYNDYKLFAITLGTGLGVAIPTMDTDELTAAVDNINDNGDFYVGMATQPIVGALGINLGFLVENLYGTIKFGYFNLDKGSIHDDLSFKSLSLGALVNYQFLESRTLPLGFLKWRGLSFGSGLMYQSNETTFGLQVDVADVPAGNVPVGSGYSIDPVLSVSPNMEMGVASKSFSVPIEATTGFRLLWIFDLSLGAGLDIGFGNSDIDAGITTPITVDDGSQEVEVEFTEGSAIIDIGTDGDGPQILRPRLTAGLGLNMGPVKLDIPFMYYFDSDGPGAMMGVNLGIVW